MSNITRKHLREFLEAMDNLAEPDAAARLHQAQMLSACAVPDDLVRVIAKIGAQGRVGMDDLNVIAGLGYALPRPQPMPHDRDEIVDALVRGIPDLPSGVGGGILVHIDDLRHVIRRAYDLGRIT
ncbi:hypothetical protein HOT42_gp93 [Microbacterium phage Metamorphoo]|uniref:Uncharacterized protein n=1 Tax=Microbacterium phage Metamorphoo TaxID=2201437 RepID=A0A2Z4Q5V6_9CAUD|nr:hypothetical protein HOT42_gp93 [Microbacterium phage Metamorphoo]AWY05442.1 hypothetical protein SEA_METAMORPHOO_92 [Microbacterium phage Metamorphoo]